VTISIVGPGGFVGRATGGQQVRGLVPGIYVVAASRGHESAMATVTLGSGETGRLTLVLDELSRSGDVPQDPAVPMTEIPAIPREPSERVQVEGEVNDEDPVDAPDAADDPDAAGDTDAATGVTGAEPRDPFPTRDPDDQLQAERGEQAYALHCARCHGANLEGDVAPALAGEVFFERWGGHPVDWLYFQARAAMPPHGPAFLSEQTYADIIVYALRESDVLDGHEDYRPHDEAFRMLTIVPRATADGRPELEAQVERLRETIQAPHDDAILGVEGPLMPIEWPDDLGAAPIGPPGRIDAAAAVEADGEEDEDAENGDVEPEDDGEPDENGEAGADGDAMENGAPGASIEADAPVAAPDEAPAAAPDADPGAPATEEAPLPAPAGEPEGGLDDVAPPAPDAEADEDEDGDAGRPNGPRGSA
jgi:mono/diheme cytochrome c family protein